ncbi:MAG: hypothetical protein GY714_20860 [Desulfobacterales bacterium]|nr:hypothetical protein [Desulfobacterales bacterium]
MNLYDINKELVMKLEAAVNPETGEIEGTADIEMLEIDRAIKISNIAKYIKNLAAMEVALKNEKKSIDNRIRTNHNKVEYLKNYLQDNLEAGEKISDPQFKISWRKSSSVKIDCEKLTAQELYDDIPGLVRYKESFEFDKKGIKEYLKEGGELEGAGIVNKIKVVVK